MSFKTRVARASSSPQTGVLMKSYYLGILLLSSVTGCAESPHSADENVGNTPLQTWAPAPGWAATGALAVAANDSELALAYVEEQYQNDGQTLASRVLVRRVDPSGRSLGEPTEIAQALPNGARFTGVAIAGDGRNWLLCWSASATVECYSLDASLGNSRSVYKANGTEPALAYQSGHWALTQLSTETPTEVSLRILPMAPPVSFGPQTGLGASSLLAATNNGFAVAAGEPLRLYRFDAAQQQAGAPIDLNIERWCPSHGNVEHES